MAAPVHLKRRGQELRLNLGLALSNPDPTRAANMLKAQSWFVAIKAGDRISDIAAAQRMPESRIRQRLPLGFLSPWRVKVITTR